MVAVTNFGHSQVIPIFDLAYQSWRRIRDQRSVTLILDFGMICCSRSFLMIFCNPQLYHEITFFWGGKKGLGLSVFQLINTGFLGVQRYTKVPLVGYAGSYVIQEQVVLSLPQELIFFSWGVPPPWQSPGRPPTCKVRAQLLQPRLRGPVYQSTFG